MRDKHTVEQIYIYIYIGNVTRTATFFRRSKLGTTRLTQKRKGSVVQGWRNSNPSPFPFFLSF